MSMPLRNLEDRNMINPSIDISRSRFDLSQSHITTFNVGQVIPIFWTEVIPGDTFDLTTSVVCRLQTLLTPIMSNLYMDTYWFFVPNRLLWTHFKEFMGENSQSAWVQPVDYQIPLIQCPSVTRAWQSGTIADYLGVPLINGFGADGINALPFRAYALIIDNWFRDQNHQDPLVINLGDSTVSGSNGSNYVTDCALGGMPFVASRYHDVFSTALPSPQKGTSPEIFTDPFKAPVFAQAYENDLTTHYPVGAKTRTTQNGNWGSTAYGFNTSTFTNDSGNSKQAFIRGSTSTGENDFTNLMAEIPQQVIADVNELRLAFQVQKFLERDARGGTRYRELILNHFGVHVPDGRVQIPEYLGGNRFPLSIHQVANTSQSSDADLGDLGAMSNTSNVHDDFVRSFTEHGILMCLSVVRFEHSYSQGLEKYWTKRSRTDFYFPEFANIGEQPVRTRELYLEAEADPMDAIDDSVWGYQEAWYDYRQKFNRTSGQMRPGISGSLASWHLGDYYSQKPTLSSSWLQESSNIVDRVLAVSSSETNQVFADFYFKCFATRPLPAYSIPGLIDHH